MAEEPEPEPMSIAARIAALKVDQVGRAPGGPPPAFKNKAVAPIQPPVAPKRPGLQGRPQSTNLPPLDGHISVASNGVCNQPADSSTNDDAPRTSVGEMPVMPKRPVRNGPPGLPPKKSSGPAPQLPPRRPSEMSVETYAMPGYGASRRTSTDSTVSALSTGSSMSKVSTRTGTSVGNGSSGALYTIKAPEFNASKLPPLPPKREKSDTQVPRIPLKANNSSPSVLPLPSGTPPLPERTISPQNATTRPSQPPRPKQSALTLGFNTPASVLPSVPASRPESVPAAGGVPPPIPTASRPDLSKLQASKPKINGASAPAPQANSCLKCRDFSVVDAHAARFPRQAVPAGDLDWLAHQLTSPFSSTTDKARAIFTWLHHNINYDTEALYSDNVKHATPASTFTTGLAVCAGFSGLFNALALKSGLECIVVSGHGKGAGYTYTAGQPIPAYKATHAWNAVKIDDGYWKLIDSTWGAGHIGAWGTPYQRKFSPECFTRDNNDFGLKHYPGDARHFYRTDGRASISWDEYILGPNNGEETPHMYSGFTSEEGIATESLLPLTKKLAVRDSRPVVRFQFQKICPHWDNERYGKGKHYVYFVEFHGVDGRNTQKVPFETNGMFWWADVPTRELGAPGQKVKIVAVASWCGRDGRGVTPAEFREKIGRCAWGGGGVADYELV